MDEGSNPSGSTIKRKTAFLSAVLLFCGELGHTLSYSYFDKYRKPVVSDSGFHKLVYEWGEMGEISKSTTYGVDNELIEDSFGTAIYKYTLTPSGLIKTIERYNDHGVLAENKDKVAITHYEEHLNGLYYIEKELNIQGVVVNDSISE